MVLFCEGFAGTLFSHCFLASQWWGEGDFAPAKDTQQRLWPSGLSQLEPALRASSGWVSGMLMSGNAQNGPHSKGLSGPRCQ